MRRLGSGFEGWSNGRGEMMIGLVQCCCAEVGRSLLIVGCSVVGGMVQERRSGCGIAVVERRRIGNDSQAWVKELLRRTGGPWSLR